MTHAETEEGGEFRALETSLFLHFRQIQIAL
jgi:hypothetical protein